MDSQRKRNLSKHSFHIKRKEIKKSAFLEVNISFFIFKKITWKNSIKS